MITIDVLANYCFVFFQGGDKMQKMSALVNLQVIDNIDLMGPKLGNFVLGLF
jgi:hypothetical protein